MSVTTDQLICALQNFDVGDFLSYEILTSGWVNLTVKIKTSNGNYILRQYLKCDDRLKDIIEIKYELEFMNYLYENGLQVPKIIKPRNNEEYLFTIDDNYCVLMEYCHGIKHVNTANTPDRELWQVTSIGQFLGKMHHASLNYDNCNEKNASCRLPINFVEVKHDLLFNCKEFKRQQPQIYDRITILLDKHTQMIPDNADINDQVLMKNFEKYLPRGCIHSDMHDDNILFDDESKTLTAVLDFDDMYYGSFIIDLSSAMCFWCFTGDNFNEEYLKILLMEYENGRKMKLTDKEWDLLLPYCYLITFNQILFTIPTDDKDNIEATTKITDMLITLLLPIEQLSLLSQTDFITKIKNSISNEYKK